MDIIVMCLNIVNIIFLKTRTFLGAFIVCYHAY